MTVGKRANSHVTVNSSITKKTIDCSNFRGEQDSAKEPENNPEVSDYSSNQSTFPQAKELK